MIIYLPPLCPKDACMLYIMIQMQTHAPTLWAPRSDASPCPGTALVQHQARARSPSSQVISSGAGGTRYSAERAHICTSWGKPTLTRLRQDERNGKDKELPRKDFCGSKR